jgi:hypothetical protein
VLRFSFEQGSCFGRLRSGPFEGPAIEKPPALPEDSYFIEAAFMFMLLINVALVGR